MRDRRRNLAAPARIAAAQRLADHFRAHPDQFGHPGYVAGYWAMDGEMPLHVLQVRLYPGQAWCLPCVRDDGTLAFAPWRTGDALVSNRFGIPEPDIAASSMLPAEEMHLVLVPMLAFDDRGNRLGTGGGFYDRSFAFRQSRPAPPALIGVGYGFQRVDALPAEDWDVPLDGALTDDGSLRFTR